jgi:hypothetical protein
MTALSIVSFDQAEQAVKEGSVTPDIRETAQANLPRSVSIRHLTPVRMSDQPGRRWSHHSSSERAGRCRRLGIRIPRRTSHGSHYELACISMPVDSRPG